MRYLIVRNRFWKFSWIPLKVGDRPSQMVATPGGALASLPVIRLRRRTGNYTSSSDYIVGELVEILTIPDDIDSENRLKKHVDELDIAAEVMES